VPTRSLIVANPRSAGGATARRLRRAEGRLLEQLGPVEIEWTRGPRDAERIAREGVRAGAERIIVAGGDGTISEVVTGLLAADLARYAELALLPLGTGGDLRRTLGVAKDLDLAIEHIAKGSARRLDAGRVHYRRPDGSEGSSYFLNVASIGISGLTTLLVNRAPKWLGGRISFLLGTLRAIVSYQPPPVALRVDGSLVHDGPLVLATAANGRYFGGGMHVAPEARPDDGLLDVVVVPGVSKLRLLRQLPDIYRGTHLGLDPVRSHRGLLLEADAAPGSVWIEVDGEPLGTLPARFEILPGSVSVVGSPP
jgi:YegS/Rv2252/BmrU family lipid kinase